MNHRRAFIQTSAAASALTLAGQNTAYSDETTPQGKAEHCIFIWLGGGACHLDTWDPKRLGDPKTRKPGSAYPAIDTAIPGTQVCQHLSRCAKVLDRFNIIRTCNHAGVPDHGAATNF
ncbi:MAG: DUF1501 domain-containing protein, partial [Planctomycetota bacterium]